MITDATQMEHLAQGRTGERRFPELSVSAEPLSGVSAEQLLHVETKDTGFQSGLPTHLLSMAIAKITVPGRCAGNERPIKQLQPFCGLLLEDEAQCTCWFYIAPYAYDSPWTALFEKTLLFLNVHERLAIYATMRWNNQDLTACRTAILSTFPEAEFVICSEGKDDACKLEIPGFAKTAKLLQYSFRLNSLASLQLALDSGFVPSWATRLALLITVLCWAFPRLDTGCSRCPVLRLCVPLSYV